ncbi:polyhydroxyalkanoate synthesis regulator DNA-binding domain-containing protein [Pseudonocardia sp. WMMC193]|uniref:polyhydroxyalkanoate synthesis regulator DNA-binding domain-containing protein n=1 Tax=Pseudonocardia sp. WMMC193 TaxID=2911965 RepID=UPI001F3AB1F5|nr:polyhydroxyalkanoate synthesis regulator DNA-binding domain-containing protein [Pseudonocardia sp. WMMC193]MCF7550742.1 polyhydroxyalkanoate synthesis regulator DNA-binding domain-containing protein [Pseudonocardia sp. WMMC193]
MDGVEGGGAASPGDARVIKRYANRKLYDTGERRFTSLAAIRRLVRDGVEVVVLDHDSGADRTEEVLTHALHRTEPGGEGAGIPVIAELIRAPGRLARAVLGEGEGERDVAELQRLRDEVDALSRKLDQLLAERDGATGDREQRT